MPENQSTKATTDEEDAGGWKQRKNWMFTETARRRKSKYEYDLSGHRDTPSEIKIVPSSLNSHVSNITMGNNTQHSVQSFAAVNDSTTLLGTKIDENTTEELVSVLKMEGYGSAGYLADVAESETEDATAPSHHSGLRSWLSGYLILAILFFGFSVGFSIGYFLSKTDFFSNTGGNNEIESSTQNDILNFMNEFIFNEIPHAHTESHSSLLRFPFNGGSPASKQRPLIYLNRQDAYSLLMDSSPSMSTISQYSSDFFLVSSGLDVQVNQAYCGVASAVAIINSLRFLKSADGDSLEIPIDEVYKPFPYATQHDIFNMCTQKNVIQNTSGGPGVDGILTPPFGLSMEQIGELLKCSLNDSTSELGWKVTTQYVDSTHLTVGKLRFDMKNALADPNSRVLVNYDRSAVGQVGGGHWSPIGSYSEKDDAFLVLDVAKYKYPPVWIPTVRLFEGMATVDKCGSWNFPDGQDALSQEERLSHTEADYASSTTKLGCKDRLRGYIIVTRTS